MSNISDAAPSYVEPVDSPEVRRLIDLNFARLMPLLVAGYVLNFLDRTNIGFAALTMNREIGLTATQFGGLTVAQVPALTVTQIPVLSTTDILALSITQASTFTAPQVLTMTNVQLDALVQVIA